MTDEVDILTNYIDVLEQRRLEVARRLLEDNSPADLQIATAAKNANNFVQINAGIAAAKNVLAQMVGGSPQLMEAPLPIAPLE